MLISLTKQHHNRGFYLTEVLVTLVIFSIGVLAMASLQIRAKQMSFEAVQRTIANGLAQEMIERMRLNASGSAADIAPTVTAGLLRYVSESGSRTYTSSTAPADITDDCSDIAVTCSEVAMADYDLLNWYQSVMGETDQRDGNNAGGLLDPTLCISGPTDGLSGVYTVAIVWRGKEAQKDSHPSSCGTEAQYGARTESLRRVVEVSVFIINDNYLD